MGRRPSLTSGQQAEARRLVDDEGQSLRAVAERYGVGKDAVARAVVAAREALAEQTEAARSTPGRASSPRSTAGPVAAPLRFPHETVTAVWQDAPGGGGRRRDVRRTRTVRVAGVPVEVDQDGRVYCDGCADWIPLDVATARGSGHRAVPGRSFVAPGLLRPMDTTP